MGSIIGALRRIASEKVSRWWLQGLVLANKSLSAISVGLVLGWNGVSGSVFLFGGFMSRFEVDRPPPPGLGASVGSCIALVSWWCAWRRFEGEGQVVWYGLWVVRLYWKAFDDFCCGSLRLDRFHHSIDLQLWV